MNIHDMNIIKMQLKKWGHRACLRVSRLLKWDIFTGWALKVRILNLGYLKGTKFVLKVKLHLLTKAVLLHLSRS